MKNEPDLARGSELSNSHYNGPMPYIAPYVEPPRQQQPESFGFWLQCALITIVLFLLAALALWGVLVWLGFPISFPAFCAVALILWFLRKR